MAWFSFIELSSNFNSRKVYNKSFKIILDFNPGKTKKKVKTNVFCSIDINKAYPFLKSAFSFSIMINILFDILMSSAFKLDYFNKLIQ